MSDELAALVADARARLRTGLDRDDAVGAELRRVDALIGQAAAPGPLPAATGHKVLDHLGAALAGVSDLATLARLGPALPWRYGYAPHPSRAGLEDRMAWAEIVGPGAPVRHAALCLGFVLFAPRTWYPPHAHPAVELYHVISGTALWTAGDVVTPRPPGSFVLHPSGLPHATRTQDAPLLTIYTWTGDVDSPSRFLSPPPASGPSR